MPTAATAAGHAGYSGTPLAKKLGIGPGTRALAIGAPGEFQRWLEPLPEGVQFAARPGATIDIAIVFSTVRPALRKRLEGLRRTLKTDAAVWVCWPKQAAKIATDISENTIRADALPLGFVDIKVCAVSEIWSGLKLVVRKELR